MTVTHKLEVDLTGKDTIQWIEVNQWDMYARKVRVLLQEGVHPWEIPEDARVVIDAGRADGTYYTYDTLPNGEAAWEADGNELTFVLAPRIVELPGKVVLNVSILHSESILNAFSLEVLVKQIEDGNRKKGKPENYFQVTRVLPSPEQAVAGQYIRVAEVDAAGRTIRLEAVEIPECSDDQILKIVRDYWAKNKPSNGKDGTSVTITKVTESTVDGGSNVVTFSDGRTLVIRNGKQGSKGDPGRDGKDGIDGKNGENGRDGQDGKDGSNGESAYALAVRQGFSGTEVEWLASLNGADGKNGKDGINGKDGYIPVKGVDYFDGKDGLDGKDGENGKDGKTPEKGVDYWTDADQEAIVQQVITALGTPVFGRMDADKNIYLSGDLADGTYTLWFEGKDGKVSELCTLVQNPAAPNYTNQIAVSTDVDGSVFNGTGYKLNTRLNSSGAVVDLDATTGHKIFTTGFIPCKQGDVMRLKDCYLDTTSRNYGDTDEWGVRSGVYNATKGKVDVFSWGQLKPDNTTAPQNVIECTVENKLVTKFTVIKSGVSFIRLTLMTDTDPANAVLTVNEEII